MSIRPEKQAELKKTMAALHIQESDLDETFVLGSGSGGQKQNKTASCVVLKHRPTGIVIKCQKSRSREDNRFFARRALCEKVAENTPGIKSESDKKREKVRKNKARRRRRVSKRENEGENVDKKE